MRYGGVEGWGVMHVEHLVARSHDGSLVGVYTNVILICRLCNTARSDAEHVDQQGRRLLDPTKDVWSHHFRLDVDQLIPMDGDLDAAYTEDVYEINDPRKVKLRRIRRERREDFLALLAAQRKRFRQLVLREKRVAPSAKDDIAKAIFGINDEIERLCRVSNEGAWVPDDAPTNCRCGRASARTLPGPYLRQVVEIELP